MLSFVALFHTLTTDFKLNNRIYAKTVISPFEIRWRGIKKRIYPATFHTTLCYQAFTCHPLYPSLRSRRRRPLAGCGGDKSPIQHLWKLQLPRYSEQTRTELSKIRIHRSFVFVPKAIHVHHIKWITETKDYNQYYGQLIPLFSELLTI